MSNLFIASVPFAEGQAGTPEVDASIGSGVMRQILEMGPEWINATSARPAFEALIRAAEALRHQEDRDTNPLHAQVLNNLGVLFFAIGDVQQANNAMCGSEMVTRGLQPADAELRGGALHNLGVLYKSNGQAQQAEQYFADSRRLGFTIG